MEATVDDDDDESLTWPVARDSVDWEYVQLSVSHEQDGRPPKWSTLRPKAIRSSTNVHDVGESIRKESVDDDDLLVVTLPLVAYGGVEGVAHGDGCRRRGWCLCRRDAAPEAGARASRRLQEVEPEWDGLLHCTSTSHTE